MRLAITMVYVAVAMGVTVLPATSQVEPVDRGGWNRESAARYLDERMDAWFTNADKLRTGETETTCASCHTTVPYVLARPVLRRAMHVADETSQERRILNEVTQRVETYGTHQLFYEFNDSKKTESRGTEAVFNALILANADVGQKRQVLNGSTRKAFARLWETQRPDGAWDWLDFGLEPFESADAAYHGATLAALAVGMVASLPIDPTVESTRGVEKLRGYLRDKYAAQSLFNRTWLLLASTRLKDLLTPMQREALITEIYSRQADDGGWSLAALGTWKWSKSVLIFQAPGTVDDSLLTKADGYATGLIVYTLIQVGLPIDHSNVRKGLQWLQANQREVQVGQQTWPAWRAYSLNYDREHGGKKGEPGPRLLMSDAATALAVLALAASE